MSIVHDFAEINKRLRGDDWWEPVACDATLAASAPPPAMGDARVIDGAVEVWTGLEWIKALGFPVPVGGGSCGVSTAADVDPLALIALSPLPEATKRLLLDKLRKHEPFLTPQAYAGAIKAEYLQAIKWRAHIVTELDGLGHSVAAEELRQHLISRANRTFGDDESDSD